MISSRGACLECRRRKKKCDERRPFCLTCGKLGITCPGYNRPLRWVHGMATRGRFVGVSTPEQAASAMPSLPQTPEPDPVHIHGPARLGKEPGALGASPLNLPRTQNAELGEVKKVFEAFLCSGLGRLHKMGSCQQVQDYVRGLATQSNALLFISAAIQESFQDGGNSLSVSTLQNFDFALKTLQEECVKSQQSFQAGTLVAGVLLCTFHFLQGWPGTHLLQLLCSAYSLQSPTKWQTIKLEEDPTSISVLESVSILDLPAFVLGRKTESLDIWKGFRKAQDNWKQGRMRGIEPITGVPRSLLDIFASVGTNDKSASDTVRSFWTWRSEEADFSKCDVWDCWRFAGILDVRRRMQVATNIFTHQEYVDTREDTFAEMETALPCLMKKMKFLLEAYRAQDNKKPLFCQGLIYPLVIASLEVSHLKHHPQWRQTLTQIRYYVEEISPFRLSKTTFQLLDDVWVTGGDDIEIHNIIRERNVEIALF